MSAIQSSHDLQEGTTASANPADAASRSSYSYIFHTLADKAESSCFPGTDDQGTLERLKEFELACHLPNGAENMPALSIPLPAAYTYFGQFLNHDISAPIGGLLQDLGQTDPVGIVGTVDPKGLGKDWRASVDTILLHFMNEHRYPLTLESLYCDGPDSADQQVKDLYQPDRRRFILGHTRPATDGELEAQTKIPLSAVHHATDAPDIPRKDGKPLIGDQRNDGNLILSQLHLAFMLFHNTAVTALEAKGRPAAKIFDEARQLVTLHYHWLILHDFLDRLLSPSVLTQPLSRWQPRAFPAWTVPMEFTTAAFRFGHSMVGRNYDFNANFGSGGRMSQEGATLQQLFDFTSKGKMGELTENFDQLPDHWVIEWDRLTRERPDGVAAEVPPFTPTGQAEKIDLDFAPAMLNVAGNARVPQEGSILYRNLLRGFHRRIPFGQVLALKYELPTLSKDAVRAAMPRHRSPDGRFPDPATAADKLGLLDNTPAWLYFLCEAQQKPESGTRLGPTASRIIADSIVGLMRNDPASLLNYKGGGWHPRDSLLKGDGDQPLDSLRRFLLFATDQRG